MDKDRWAKEPIKALGSHNIKITTEYLSGDYDEPTCAPVARSLDNGLLELLRIEPKRPGFPSFSARWDLADDSIDIDLSNDPEERRRFARSEKGYRGHKTQRVTDNPRTQRIDIETPVVGHVFTGTVTLNIDLGVTMEDSLNLNASLQVNADVIRNGQGMRPEESWVARMWARLIDWGTHVLDA